MKKYKVLKSESAEAFETDLNQMARNGWKVVSSNLSLSTTGSDVPVFFALLENKDTDSVLKELMAENTDSLTNTENIDLSPSDN